MPKSDKKDGVQERLEALRQAVKDARDEKVRLEERAKAKAEERSRILAELQKLGVAESDLDSTIEKLARKLDEELHAAERIVAAAECADPIVAAEEAGGEFTQAQFAEDDDHIDGLDDDDDD
jgi:chromosome segregation ATPase